MPSQTIPASFLSLPVLGEPDKNGRCIAIASLLTPSGKLHDAMAVKSSKLIARSYEGYIHSPLQIPIHVLPLWKDQGGRVAEQEKGI